MNYLKEKIWKSNKVEKRSGEQWAVEIIALLIVVILLASWASSPVNEGGSECYGPALWDC